MKKVKDGWQPSQGVGLESCVPSAWRRAQYGHSASPSPATRMSFASLFTIFSTTVVHHSLLGASVVLQYMYMCIELCIRGWTYHYEKRHIRDILGRTKKILSYLWHFYDDNCDKTRYHHRCDGLLLLWQKIMTENGLFVLGGPETRLHDILWAVHDEKKSW